MKMFRRLAAFTVALAMVLVMLPATLSVSAGELPEDVKGTKYEAAASLLCALDIMVGDGTNFNPDNNVTRAEFAKILVTAMGYLDVASSFAPSGMFDDVPVGEWYAPFVEYAAQFGAINGYGDGRFGPNDNVTGYQAIKMLCFASGHNACIEDPIGGFPREYANVAREYGFNKNLSDVVLSEPMTRGQVAILTSNVMKADMLKLSGTSVNSNSYEVMEGKSLLSERHNVFKFDGLVTDNGKTGIRGASTIFPEEVQIESGATVLVFKQGETKIGDELGTYVRTYYKADEDANTRTVISYDITSSKNTKISVPFDDIDILSSTSREVRYWPYSNKEANSVKIRIDSACSILWNGSASSYTDAKTAIDYINSMGGMNATLDFSDSNGDGEMDVLSIKAYETYVVSRIDDIEYKITDEYSNSKTVTIDEESGDMIISIKDNVGDEYSFFDIAIGDVLSVAKSSDNTMLDILISLDIVEGSISTIGRKDGRMFLEIDGEEYYLTKDYFDEITDNDPNCAISALKDIKIGKNYEFKLDAFGDIAYAEVLADEDKGIFGFIMDTAIKQDASGDLIVKMFAEGYIEKYSVAESVKIDGTRCKGAQIVTAIDDAASYIQTYIPQNDVDGAKGDGYYGTGWKGIPVLFELDDDGNISYIDTPRYVDGVEDKYTLHPVVEDRTIAVKDRISEISTRTYVNSSFGNKLPLASSINVIQLPKYPSDFGNEEKWSTSKTFNGGKKYYVQLFSTDPDAKTSNYVVVANGAKYDPSTGSGSSSNFTTDYVAGLNDSDTVNGGNGVKSTPLFVVSEVYKGIAGEDDEETIIISGYERGELVEYTFDPGYYADGAYFTSLTKELMGVTSLDPLRTKDNPYFEGDVLRLARNKETGYVTFAGPVFYISEKFFVGVTIDGKLEDNASEYAYYQDIAAVQKMEGTNADLSYMLINDGNNKYKKDDGTKYDEEEHYYGSINMVGNRIGANGAVKMEATYTNSPYETSEFSKMMDLGGFSRITTYNASKHAGKKVSKGSLSHIVTLEDATATKNPSIILMHHRYGGTYSMVIINL